MVAILKIKKLQYLRNHLADFDAISYYIMQLFGTVFSVLFIYWLCSLLLTIIQTANIRNDANCLLIVVDCLSLHQNCKFDLVESLPVIQNLMQSMLTCHTSFLTQITDPVFTRMTSVYCVSRVQSNTQTPSFQSVYHHQKSTLISSKSALTPASAEQHSKVS